VYAAFNADSAQLHARLLPNGAPENCRATRLRRRARLNAPEPTPREPLSADALLEARRLHADEAVAKMERRIAELTAPVAHAGVPAPSPWPRGPCDEWQRRHYAAARSEGERISGYNEHIRAPLRRHRSSPVAAGSSKLVE
jgi:hypothetical protein